MRRALELLLILGVVAGAVSYTRTGRSEGAAVSASPLPAKTARPVDTSVPADPNALAPGQTAEATTLWKSLYDEAQMALGQGDNARAQSNLEGALKVAPMATPEALHETLDDLGLVSYRLGDYQRSADYQARAIEAASKLPAPESAATVALYESRYSLALHALGRDPEALAALGRSEAAYKQAYPAGSPAYADAMTELAAQHRAMGDNDGAARLAGQD